MSDDINAKVMEWLTACPYINDIFFAFSRNDFDGTAIVPVASDEWLERYTDGTGTKLYTLSLIQYRELSDIPNSPLYLDTKYDIKKIIYWVEEQDLDANYPDIGAGRTVDEITVPQNLPDIAGVDGVQAKYMFSIQIKYFTERDL